MLKTQNLCCPREGRVNTKRKLVRRPGREMGSVIATLNVAVVKIHFYRILYNMPEYLRF